MKYNSKKFVVVVVLIEPKPSKLTIDGVCQEWNEDSFRAYLKRRSIYVVLQCPSLFSFYFVILGV